jgi:hypothetical protein
MYQNFISYLHEALHVSGDTAYHQEPKTALAPRVLHMRRVVGCVVAGCIQQLHVQQPSAYAKPEAASAVLGS